MPASNAPISGDWLWIGFVFSPFPTVKIPIIHCYYYLNINLPHRQIGFVFSNSLSGKPPYWLISIICYLDIHCFKFPAEGRQIGFVWLCFLLPSTRKILHIPLLHRHLRSFCLFWNWLCFFKCTLSNSFGFRAYCFGFPTEGRHIGFVFLSPKSLNVHTITFMINTYAHFVFSQIGFVFSNSPCRRNRWIYLRFTICDYPF